MSNRVNHQEIVKKLLDAKVVDFSAIGKTFAQIGPSLALADAPWEGWCGTMRGDGYVVRNAWVSRCAGSACGICPDSPAGYPPTLRLRA